MKTFAEFVKLIVPQSNETKEIDVLQTWEVTWRSGTVRGNWMPETTPNVEAFITADDAEAFAHSLRQAFQLTRMGGLIERVAVTKRPAIR
jgi:hypothetical protein